MPLLTVLMSVRNAGPYLRKSVESILGQTFRDFEFLILDNASEDDSRQIVRSFGDPRIRLIELPADIGQAAALNKGLDMIETPLVARMDADDISLPRRLARQVAFMEKHPDIGACGTYVVAFEGRHRQRWRKPCRPGDVRARLLLGCCLAHPSVMLRKELFDRFQLRYDERIGFSEDWELWLRAAWHFPLANIPEYLVKYRIHAASVSSRHFAERQKVDAQLIRKALVPLGLDDHPLHGTHKAITLATTFDVKNKDPEFIARVREWFRELAAANRETGIYGRRALQRALNGRLFLVLRLNPQLKGLALKIFLRERLFLYTGALSSVIFLAKVILFSLGLRRRR